jgi:uncharacterized protein
MWALVLGRGGFEPPKALGQLIYSQSRLTASVSARPRNSTDNLPVDKRRWILWQGLIAPSMERFILASANGGFELSGLVLQAEAKAPYVARYTIGVDESWRTRRVDVELENGGRRTFSMTSDGTGLWSGAGGRLPAIEGCLDVDLEWSPSTNTLPIRRLGLTPGQVKPVAAAWIRFPSLAVVRLDQSYERLSQARYRYRAGRFTADLEVDADGLVLSYGVNWKAVISSSGKLQ